MFCLAARGRWLAVCAALALAALAAGCTQRAPAATRPQGDAYELGAYPVQLLLGGEAVYFAGADSPVEPSRRIYRLDLETRQVSEVLSHHFYPDGVLDSYRLGLAGDWLVYLEVSGASNGQSWTLAAKNLVSGELLTIDQAAGDAVGWPGPEAAADGEWVVWVRKEETPAGPRSRIHAYNLARREHRLLAGALDTSREAWGWPNLHDGRLVVEREGMSAEGPTSSVALIDLRTGAVSTLSGSQPASQPSLDGRYVAWKGGLRYGAGPLVIHDLDTGTTRTVALNVEYPHSDGGTVVVYAEGQGLVRVDAASGRYITLTGGEGYRPGFTASLDGRRVAWLEYRPAERGVPLVRLRVMG
jgi:hypothetical protein